MGKSAASKKRAQAKVAGNKPKSVISDKDSRQKIAESIAPKRRQLKTRNTEEAASRAIEERFPGVPSHILQSKPCKCGRLLHAKICDDLRKARRLRKRLGATYWRDLQAYFSQSAPLELIKVPVEDIASPQLIQALKKAASHFVAERSAEPVQAYLGSCDGVNVKEIVGILKICVAPKRLNRADRDVILISLLRCLSRLGPETMQQHLETLRACKDLIDETLAAMFLQAQKARVKASTWIQARRCRQKR